MIEQTALETLLEKHIDAKAEEKIREQKMSHERQIRLISNEIIKKHEMYQDTCETFNKNKLSISNAMSEGGMIAILDLIDSLNSWILDEDQQIIIDGIN